MSRKKLVLATGGRPMHRACRSAAGRSAVPPGLTRAPQDISRAELLRRIEALRERDARAKPGTTKVQPASRPERRPAPHRGQRPPRPPQPYYGVDMKFIDGRWVQMHPDAE
ncbi:hypothetical protein [Streptomyces sp. NPDC051310]|uniref:hypothetical protein n=1 Tax=Streptomyces sp. NPDC051310 TaxID=3365649 RepID=UPI00378AF7D3